MPSTRSTTPASAACTRAARAARRSVLSLPERGSSPRQPAPVGGDPTTSDEDEVDLPFASSVDDAVFSSDTEEDVDAACTRRAATSVRLLPAAGSALTLTPHAVRQAMRAANAAGESGPFLCLFDLPTTHTHTARTHTQEGPITACRVPTPVAVTVPPLATAVGLRS